MTCTWGTLVHWELVTYSRIKDPRVCFRCQYCNAVVIEPSNRFTKRTRYNCLACAFEAKRHVGSDNGMFGKTHTDEVKQILAASAVNTHKGISYEDRHGKEKADDLKRQRSERMKITKAQYPSSWSKGLVGIWSPAQLQRISETSAAKWESAEYRVRHRKKMEEMGRYIPIELLDDYTIYRKECDWIQPMWDLVPGGLDKLKVGGVFNCRANANGHVRDHRLSRRDGLGVGMFPVIMRHPCNCDVLTNLENLHQKGSSSNITVEELLESIENYEEDWAEQKEALEAVQQYRAGARYTIIKEG